MKYRQTGMQRWFTRQHPAVHSLVWLTHKINVHVASKTWSMLAEWILPLIFMGTIGRREAVVMGFQVVKESSSQWHALVQTLAVENGLVINFIVTSPFFFLLPLLVLALLTEMPYSKTKTEKLNWALTYLFHDMWLLFLELCSLTYGGFQQVVFHNHQEHPAFPDCRAYFHIQSQAI